MRRSRSILVLLLLLVFVGPATFGDTLFLKNGQSFSGKLVKVTATQYFFKIPGLGEQRFSRAEVLRVEKGPNVFDKYAAKKAALKPGDSDGHYKLGLWCKKHDLRTEAKAEFKAAIAANPDHAEARAALGYVKYEGKWITKAKRAKILAEIAKHEKEIFDKLALGKMVTNAKARFSFQPPADWKEEKKSETDLVFTGPVLGKAPVTIEFEVTDSGDSLDDMAQSVTDDVKSAHDDMKAGKPADQKLAGRAARLLDFEYVRNDLAPQDLEIERHDLIAATPAGNFRFEMECRQGYWDRLKSFFDKMTGTLKILDKPPDYVNKKWGFSIVFPDNTYTSNGDFTMSGPNGKVLIPKAAATIVSNTMSNRGLPSAMFMVFPGKKSDKKVDTSTLPKLKDSIRHISADDSFFQISDDGSPTTVAGVDGLKGKMKLVMSFGQVMLKFGSGRWCVFVKGDRYFRLLFINAGSQMGEQYVESDFNKFLAGFRVK